MTSRKLWRASKIILAIGLESGSRQRRKAVLKSIEKNFNSGIDVGLRIASRTAQEQGITQ